MRTLIIVSIALLAPLALGGTRAYAHHSNVAFAVETVLTAKGVVKELRWSNPHTWLIMDVDDGKGGQGGLGDGRARARCAASRRLDAKVVKPGDEVRFTTARRRTAARSGMIARVTLADGRVLPNAPPGRLGHGRCSRESCHSSILAATMVARIVAMQAQTPPDFSGVYRPINAVPARPAGARCPRRGARRRPPAPGQPLPPPARTAPLSDGSRGRARTRRSSRRSTSRNGRRCARRASRVDSESDNTRSACRQACRR